MNLIDLVNKIVQSTLENNSPTGWGTIIIISLKDGSQPYSFSGLAIKHFTKTNNFGEIINTKQAHINFSENSLYVYLLDEFENNIIDEFGNNIILDSSFLVRNNEGEIALLECRVAWKDSSGRMLNYSIEQQFPDETIGMITCILGDLKI
jgi:hypothetical protein